MVQKIIIPHEFEILDEIGNGYFGKVYKIKDTWNNNILATKIININELVIKIENSRCFKCFTKIGSFVSVNTLGNKFESTVNNINDKIKEIAINQTNKGFTPFQGGGIMVGGVMNTEDYSGVNDNNTSTSVEVQKTQNESLEAKFHS